MAGKINKRKNERGAINKRVWVSMALLGVVAVMLAITYAQGYKYGDKDRTAYDNLTKVSYYLPSEIHLLGQKIGLSDDSLIKTRAQIGKDPNFGSCPLTTAQACYNPTEDSIRLYVSSFSFDPAQSLAYEYYHHVWHVMTPQERSSYQPYFDQLATKLQTTRSGQDLLSFIKGEGPTAYYDELHSVACAEVADTELPANLLAHCTQYVPNRNTWTRVY